MRLVDAEFEEKHYLSMLDNPTPDVTENDKRTALAIARAFQMARTVEPERKKGRWKKTYLDHEAIGERPSIFYCFVCNQCIAYLVNYCPSCGADMRGEQYETN